MFLKLVQCGGYYRFHQCCQFMATWRGHEMKKLFGSKRGCVSEYYFHSHVVYDHYHLYQGRIRLCSFSSLFQIHVCIFTFDLSTVCCSGDVIFATFNIADIVCIDVWNTILSRTFRHRNYRTIHHLLALHIRAWNSCSPRRESWHRFKLTTQVHFISPSSAPKVGAFPYRYGGSSGTWSQFCLSPSSTKLIWFHFLQRFL